ncbi:S-adenosylmethionine-dependent methyltransferase-like protein [Thermochaetoides thermophila DSM 1495]|uniref:carnosine N-methyltransferase n=1 Tax=Chaetomium thermophilum (strain DSM 1495 / CBS 144.50 / IMI 039719) TaxID=759272 RepID=G0SGZ4_CHATD|nr:S-adenosylmethionine-dependent methyltransferase-like protein [Thermochaetoides thermophila DSM 1495]EGS17483.1 S-adenosylmethionine-dependent methyltransferase-like protein [Thermochaetoides thermophila DSM 1495]
MENETPWSGVETTVEDPEELGVIFRTLDSYQQYAKVAHFQCTHIRRQAFYALPQAHWKRLAAPPFNYLDTLDKVDEAIDSNAELARIIVQTGLDMFRIGVRPDNDPTGPLRLPRQWEGSARHNDIDKARSTIRQFYRDWSAEGAQEREACFGPVLRAITAEQEARGPEYPPLKVLVPGAGLGRFVFELCLNGFDTEGNEISYHQLLASSYILNTCERAGMHTIYPWIHTFSNHRSRANHLRGYSIPDIHPATALAEAEKTRRVGTMSMSAADFLCLYAQEDRGNMYDVVASVFFLDTAPNLIRYLETIYHCLKPNGILINIGPLLWHFEGRVWDRDEGDDSDERNTDTSGIADPGNFELTDDEVMMLVEQIGFKVEHRQTGLETPYIMDTQSMLQTSYRASFWIARKPLKEN